MAAVDYYAILDRIKTAFEGDQRTGDARAYIEEDPQFDLMGAQQAIAITLMGRSPTSGQPIAAGKRTRWNVRIGVWAIGFGMDYRAASQVRDALVGQIELVLMDNRTVGGLTEAGWLEGGEFVNVRAEQQNLFIAMAETIFNAQALAAN